MSTPISCIASSAAGLISSAGVEPAERTWMRPFERSLTRPAAIWLRPALCVQTNNTSGCSLTISPCMPASFGSPSYSSLYIGTRLFSPSVSIRATTSTYGSRPEPCSFDFNSSSTW